jgi:hypothetical protein
MDWQHSFINCATWTGCHNPFLILAQMNEAIAKDYTAKSKNKVWAHHIKPVSESEFFFFWHHHFFWCR